MVRFESLVNTERFKTPPLQIRPVQQFESLVNTERFKTALRRGNRECWFESLVEELLKAIEGSNRRYEEILGFVQGKVVSSNE